MSSSSIVLEECLKMKSRKQQIFCVLVWLATASFSSGMQSLLFSNNYCDGGGGGSRACVPA